MSALETIVIDWGTSRRGIGTLVALLIRVAPGSEDALTLTLSCTPAIWSTNARDALSPRTISIGSVRSRNPWAAMVSVWRPGSSSSVTAPAESLTVDVAAPPPSGIAVTRAPGRGLRLASSTVPCSGTRSCPACADRTDSGTMAPTRSARSRRMSACSVTEVAPTSSLSVEWRTSDGQARKRLRGLPRPRSMARRVLPHQAGIFVSRRLRAAASSVGKPSVG